MIKVNNLAEAYAITGMKTVVCGHDGIYVQIATPEEIEIYNTKKGNNITIGNRTIIIDSIINNNIKIGNDSYLFNVEYGDYSYNSVRVSIMNCKIGKFCSIACGAKFIFNSANHTLSSLSTYPFPIFFEEWGLDVKDITKAWDNKGDIVVGNDVWIGYEAVILAGVTIGDGAIIGARAVVTKDVPPYTIVGGVPAKPIRKRFIEETIDILLKLKWWDWSKERIAKNIAAIQSGNVKQLN